VTAAHEERFLEIVLADPVVDLQRSPELGLAD
jgi:hypothetical protein